jgi:DNA-binding response OmpR family regulator
VGIVILTGRMRDHERLEGYSSGADVYLTKPTRPEELVAVIRNLFARLSPSEEPAQWRLDLATLTLFTPQGAGVSLTGGEMLLLKSLSLAGQYLDRASLAQRLARPDASAAGKPPNLEVLISRLRRKLQPHIGDAPAIASIRSQGYQLCLPLTLVNLVTGPEGNSAARG